MLFVFFIMFIVFFFDGWGGMVIWILEVIFDLWLVCELGSCLDGLVLEVWIDEGVGEVCVDEIWVLGFCWYSWVCFLWVVWIIDVLLLYLEFFWEFLFMLIFSWICELCLSFLFFFVVVVGVWVIEFFFLLVFLFLLFVVFGVEGMMMFNI